jgi:hypothetical protein
VIGSLMDRGLPSDSALHRVQAKLAARATDRELESMPGKPGTPSANKPAVTGPDLADTKKPTATPTPRGGPPAGIPANGGKKPATIPPTTKKPPV